MNKISIFFLRSLHKLYREIVCKKKSDYLYILESEYDSDEMSSIISDKIIEGKPFMVARYGSTELMAMMNCIAVDSDPNYIKYIKGEQSAWWWMPATFYQMEQWSGFFPANEHSIRRFTELMLNDSKEVDILAEWKSSYKYVKRLLPSECIIAHLANVEPFFSKIPWTKALSGKRVLVVHPFAELIVKQFSEKREKIFSNTDMLPNFQLLTLKAVQSLGGESSGFKDWFEALDWMKSEIDRTDYDVCLLGCGAYGFPLAAHCKRKGKQAIHLGGSLQLLFGIIGHRWENPDYGVKEWGIAKGTYSNLINDYWVRPGAKDRPKNSQQVENACYW